jgi:hypothetical protein
MFVQGFSSGWCIRHSPHEGKVVLGRRRSNPNVEKRLYNQELIV